MDIDLNWLWLQGTPGSRKSSGGLPYKGGRSVNEGPPYPAKVYRDPDVKESEMTVVDLDKIFADDKIKGGGE